VDKKKRIEVVIPIESAAGLRAVAGVEGRRYPLSALSSCRTRKLPDSHFMATLTAKSARPRASSSARLEARIPREFKKTLEQAAAVTGHPTSPVIFSSPCKLTRAKSWKTTSRPSFPQMSSANFVKALLALPLQIGIAGGF